MSIKIGSKEFELDTPYDTCDIVEVASNKKVYDIIKDKCGIELPADFDYRWSAEKGGAYGAGLLTKRIKSFLKKEYNIIIDDSVLSLISNLYTNKVNNYDSNYKFNSFVLTKTRWDQNYIGGDDTYSCWHTFNCGAFDLVADIGGFFIIFFTGKSPVARVAVTPANGGPNCWMLSNSSNVTLKWVASMLSTMCGTNNKHFPKMRNDSRKITYGLYSHGEMGWGIGPDYELEQVKNWEINDTDYNVVWCNVNEKYYTKKYWKTRLLDELAVSADKIADRVSSYYSFCLTTDLGKNIKNKEHNRSCDNLKAQIKLDFDKLIESLVVEKNG